LSDLFYFYLDRSLFIILVTTDFLTLLMLDMLYPITSQMPSPFVLLGELFGYRNYTTKIPGTQLQTGFKD